MTSENTVVQEDGFGFAPRRTGSDDSNEKAFSIVRRYTMTNKNGGSVRLISWGAGIQSVRVPNARGVFGDVVLGFDDMPGYLRTRYIGRVINSVSDNARHTNFKNDTDLERRVPCCSSEKYQDYDDVNWESQILGRKVIMSYAGRNTVGQRPGKMLIHVKYTWTDENELKASILATVTESTPANFTVICPMNLAGHATGAEELRKHVVTINSENTVPMNPGQKWFNATAKVNPNFHDLRNPTRLKNRLGTIAGGGYDHAMSISSPSDWCYRFHSRILHPDSGRFVEVYSDKANLKFSTMNDFPDRQKYSTVLEDRKCRLAGGDFYSVEEANPEQPGESGSGESSEVRGKDGAVYGRHSGFVCSPRNRSTGKTCRSDCLHPGEVFVHDMSFKFGVECRVNN